MTETTTSIETVTRVVAALRAHSYLFASEVGLHAGMAQALTAAGFAHRREVVAGPADRFDFLLLGGIVIEAKIKGSFAQALIQITRYAQRDDVSAIILAATRLWAKDGGLPMEISGKPVRVVKLTGRAF